jgi:opacity protein-like surface antigen
MRLKIILKISSVFLFAAFLTAAGFAESEIPVQKTYTSKWTPKRNVANIYIGGLLSFIRAGYDYQYTDILYGEEMTLSDSVDNSEAMGFSAGAGFYVIENLEIAFNLNTFSKPLSGLYGFCLPNLYLWDDIACDEMSANPVFKETVFHFTLNIHPLTTGIVRPYIGAGVSLICGKMDLLNDMIYEETFFIDWTHDIDITEVEFVETNVNKFGFNVSGGMDFYITNRVAFYAFGRYIIAKKEVEHPLTSQWEDGEILELDLGGLSANLGIKVFF